MAHIHLTTLIAAPAERVFDLSRSINLHQIGTGESNQKAIGGVLRGLISAGESVTWQAKHLFKIRQFTSHIKAMEAPKSFMGEMTMGDFKSFTHEHHFKPIQNGTILIDLVDFESPYGLLGQMVNQFYLKNYITQLLINRNKLIQQYAESTQWKALLS